jgi:uroporphyrinogen-III decarboxylase
MSFDDGWAAIHLDMPKRVPRTEYSADAHWQLVEAVTGIHVDPDSPNDVKSRASQAFRKAWNYDLWWGTLIYVDDIEEKRTKMGHAIYAAGGVDFNTDIQCPFNTPEEALAFDPWETYGRRDHAELVQRFEEDYRTKCEKMPDILQMTGTYITLISGLIEIFGWDMLLLAAGTDMEAFGEVANRYASWMQQYYDALADADVPLVMVHDDIVWSSGPFLHPAWYRKYVFPNYRKYFAPIIDSGKKLLYTSDGCYTEFIDDIAGCGVHGFVLEPLTDMNHIAEKYGTTHVFVGNADTRVLLSGSKAQIRAEVERCMNIGKQCPGFFMAVGNHIAPNTPVENAMYYNEVYEELSQR